MLPVQRIKEVCNYTSMVQLLNQFITYLNFLIMCTYKNSLTELTGKVYNIFNQCTIQIFFLENIQCQARIGWLFCYDIVPHNFILIMKDHLQPDHEIYQMIQIISNYPNSYLHSSPLKIKGIQTLCLAYQRQCTFLYTI